MEHTAERMVYPVCLAEESEVENIQFSSRLVKRKEKRGSERCGRGCGNLSQRWNLWDREEEVDEKNKEQYIL